MHVLLLSTYFKPDIASTGVLMTGLAKNLQRLGHQVSVVTSMPHYSESRIWPEYRGKMLMRDRYQGLDVKRVYLYVPRSRGRLVGRALNYISFNAFSMLAGLFHKRYDVILSPSPPLTNGLAAYVLSRLRGTPYIYNVQDIYPDVAIRLNVLKDPKAIALFKAMERFVYKKAAAISVISQGFRRNLLRKGVPEEKIHVMPNFIDTDFVRPLSRYNQFSEEHKLDDRYVVLFAGNVGMSQGLGHVLQVARQLDGNPEILFLIVGQGSAKPGLVRQAEEMKLTNVKFLPFQPHEALPQMYASADVCLVPLRSGFTQESVPCKVYTIMAAGKPLIAAVDEGSDTWDLVQQTGCGRVVPPEDQEAMGKAIRWMFYHREMARSMGLAGRVRAEAEFTPEVVASQYEELLTKVVARS